MPLRVMGLSLCRTLGTPDLMDQRLRLGVPQEGGPRIVWGYPCAVLASHGGCYGWNRREMPTLRTSIAGNFSLWWFCRMEEVVRQGRVAGAWAQQEGAWKVCVGSESPVCGVCCSAWSQRYSTDWKAAGLLWGSRSIGSSNLSSE